MPTATPTAELDPRFSSPDAAATPWPDAEAVLRDAGTYWLTTVRADGRPHVTPLLGVWHDGAVHVCTGPEEQKARNLAADPRCALTTGCNEVGRGLDVVVEATAERVEDDATLRLLAEGWVAAYGEDWRFDVADGAFHHADGEGVALVLRLTPTKVLAFHKGEPFAQTRYRV